MNRYNAQILNDKGEYHLQFETDNRENFNAMEMLAQKCVDKKPQTNFEKITQSVESFCDWVFESYKNTPEYVPCMVENCETTNRMDCKKCFKEWLQKESE